MATQVHELEGVLFENPGNYRGAIMIDGVTYELVGVVGEKNGGRYIQLRARRRQVEVREISLRPSPRGERLMHAMDEVQRKYRRTHR